jgi:hypothetical protein
MRGEDMREILFKGKRVDNGEWVEGFFFQIWEKTYILWGTTNGIPNMIEVIPESISQYTGRDDLHGKKMYEGDRVRFVIRESHYWSQGEIKYDNCSFYIDCFGFACYTWLDYHDFEIIGNVHDTESEVGR